MRGESDYIEDVGSLVKEFEKSGLDPVLVGGMALVLLGSQRVTKDFDFLVSRKGTAAKEAVEILYRHGFQLISKFNDKGEALRTIDNPKVATSRLDLDSPDSVFFYNHDSGLKIDLLLDFPLPAEEISARADKIKIRSHFFRVASVQDLIRLKEISFADRKAASDAQDLEFLRKIKLTPL